MKKYTDTELLEKLLPMLKYSVVRLNLTDTVDLRIFESWYRGIDTDFVVALQNRIINLQKRRSRKIWKKTKDDARDLKILTTNLFTILRILNII